MLMKLRMNKRNLKNIVLLGKSTVTLELFHILKNPIYGYNILGTFYDGSCDDEEYESQKIASPEALYEWVQPQAEVKEVYASTSEFDKKIIKRLNKFCDNNLIRFYQVPTIVTNNKDVSLIMKGKIAVISSRNEPLADPVNQFIKRAFDLFFSTLALITIYPIVYIIVAIIIKRTSPGPVYFKQERTGMNGKIFKCIKFRSMKVNNDADSLQATKDDPRKYPFGDFMRRTNIDELPQLINVWKGEMSIVGPRPHMLKHTEEYSKIINKFMVRHLAKPGITGLAQVTGYRGETKQIDQMEGRVKKDIEYIENWSIWLDLRIIIKTLNKMISGDKNAY
jgi:putative colanic acid biosynthesis UDP-glucose lipid carrier transferase